MEKESYIGKDYNKVKEQLSNNGRRTEKSIFKKKIKIGYDIEGISRHPVFLECNISVVDLSTETIFNGDGKILSIGNTKETIHHKKISKYYTLSISGHSLHFAGQIYDNIKDLKGSKPELKRIIKIWKEWHLNDLSPNCIHQKSFDCNDNFTEKAKVETLKCPKKYSYGSKWLVKELPGDIMEEIQELFTNYKVL